VVLGAACTLGIAWWWKRLFPQLWHRDGYVTPGGTRT
jgi:hypothetical protein